MAKDFAEMNSLASTHEMKATNKVESVSGFVKAWESKNARRAVKGAGLSTMALTLAACGGEDNTPFAQADIDAATTPIQADLDEALAALELVPAQIQAALQEDSEATIAAINEALGTEFTTESTLEEIVAGIQVTNDLEVFDAGAASRDEEVAGLQQQIAELLAADAALDARTLDADNETFDAGDAADYEIIVLGTTGNGDTLNATVTGTGTGTLTFTFADGDDTVVLAVADLSSYQNIVISAGTVDLTAVTLAAGVNIEINSGVVITSTQFLAAGTITSAAGTGELTVVVTNAADIAAIQAKFADVSGVSGANIDLQAADGVNAAAVAAAQTTVRAAEDAAEADANHLVGLFNGLAAVAPAALAVTTAVDELDAFVASTFSNPSVQLLVADINRDGAITAADTTQADVTQAAVNDLVALDAAVTAEAVPGFAAGNGAVKSALISLAQGNLQGAIDLAEAAVDVSGAALLPSVEALVAAAELRASELTTDLNIASVAAAQQGAVEAAFLAANLGAGAPGGNIITLDFDVDGAGVIVAIAITERNADGVVVLRTAADILAEIEAAAGLIPAAVNTAIDEVAEVQAILDGLFLVDEFLAAANAEIEAFAGASTAADALATAINAVYNAQDLDGYDHDNDPNTANIAYNATYAELTNGNAAAIGDVIAIDVQDQNAVTITFAGNTADAQLDAAVADAANGIAIDTHNTNLAALETANSDLTVFNGLVDAWEATTGLVAELVLGQTAITDAQADLADAWTAVEGAIGVGVVIDVDGQGLANAGQNNILAINAAGQDGAAFGDTGRDFILFDADEDFVGGDYTFNILADDFDTVTTPAGDASVLEVFLQNNGNGGVDVWIEALPASGSALLGGAPDFTITNGAVELSISDLTVDADNGILYAGDYTV